MFKRILAIAVLGCMVWLPTAIATAADQTQEQVYGSQLMTAEERAEHRAKIRSLKTKEERKTYMLEHHKMIVERAKERGVKVPEMTPAKRKSMGDGPFSTGTGGGRGGGGGRGR